MPLINSNGMQLSPDIRIITFTLASSAIDYIEYNLLTQDATVHFTDGTVYNYTNVPDFKILDLITAPSSGKYFNYGFRNLFSFERL